MAAPICAGPSTSRTSTSTTSSPPRWRTHRPPRAAGERVRKDGCTHMRRAFDIEDINLDDLIATAMEDPQAVTGDVKILQGISFGDLHVAYREFCKNEPVEASPVDLTQVIAYYNTALADLPDHTRLKGLKLP